MVQGPGESQQQIDGIKIQSPATIPTPNKNIVQPTKTKRFNAKIPKRSWSAKISPDGKYQTGLTFNLARYHDGSPPT